MKGLRSTFEQYRDVISILGEKKFMVVTRLMNLANISWKPSQKILANLISLGMIKKVKIEYTTRYHIVLTPLGLKTYEDIKRNRNMSELEGMINKIAKGG